MATKAQDTKNAELVAKRSRNPKRTQPARDDANGSAQRGSAADRKAARAQSATRNASKRAAGKAVAVLEDSTTERPPRKSTRRSAAHLKGGTQLERRQTRRVTSPKARATRANAKKAK
jgi:hypothetical protein